MFKIKLILILVLVIIVLPVNRVFADQSSDFAKYRVSHLPGFFEKVIEKISMSLKFSDKDKVSYYDSLLDKRLGEIIYITEQKDTDDIEQITSRYLTYTGILEQMIKSTSLNNLDKNKINQQIDDHLKVINDIQSSYQHDSGWWLYMQHDINGLNELKNTIK